MKPLTPVFLFFALFVCSIPLGATDHPWIEVQSEHFTVLCNSGEKDAREAAIDLERIRFILFKGLPGFRADPNVPIVVFLTADEDLYGSLVPAYNQKSRTDKPYSIVQSGRDQNLIAGKTGFHQGGREQNGVSLKAAFISAMDYKMKWDYAALVARSNFRRAPAWVTAGMADFFALSEITDDQAKLGMPLTRYTAIISDRKSRVFGPTPMIPMARLVTMSTRSREYRDEETQRYFYAASWGLFHYLMMADQGAHRTQLESYLQSLAQGKKQLAAAEDAFGDLGKLQDKLAVYFRSFGFPIAVVPFSPKDFSQEFAVHTLTQPESNARLAEFYLRSKRTADAKPLLDAALAENPSLPLAHEAMGMYYLEQVDFVNALKEFSAATTGESRLFLSYYYKGVLASYGKSGSDIPASSEADLRHAVELNPRYAPASMALARLIIHCGGNPAEAVAFARQAVESEHSVARYHIAYANILLQAGEASKAEAEASQTLEDSLPASEEADARAILLLAQSCPSGTPCKALGTGMSVEAVPTIPAHPAAADAAPSSTAQDSDAPKSRIRGVVRSLTCSSDGRELTLAVAEKTLNFTMPKKSSVSTPETFWLTPSANDFCKALIGEPAEVHYKSAQPGSAPLEATSLQTLDRF